MKHKTVNSGRTPVSWRIILGLAVAVMAGRQDAAAAQAPVDLGTAGHFTILAKSGISAVPACAITGDIGVSPIDSTAVTGFPLTLGANGTTVLLSGGAMAGNAFWQSFGEVTVGTGSHMEGILLSQTAIGLQTGASISGRLLAQTAVTLDANAVSAPPAAQAPALVSAPVVTGPYVATSGQSVNLSTRTLTAPVSGSRQFYRIRAATALTATTIRLSDGNVVITYN